MSGPFSVLIVDDHPDLRKIYRLQLEQHGYSVLEASNGEEALNQFAHHDIDLVVSDIVMPGVDGIELLKLVKETIRDCEVILCSSQATLEHAIEGLNHGAFFLFEKTRPIEILMAEVERALQYRYLNLKNRELRNELIAKNKLLRLSNQEMAALNEELSSVVQFYEQTINGVTQPVVVFQQDGRVLFANTRFRTHAGIPEDEETGGTLRELVPTAWSDAERWSEMLDSLGKPGVKSVPVPDGTLFITPLPDTEPARFLMVYQRT